MLTTLLLMSAVAANPRPAIELPHKNWENHPQRAMAISPDRQTLAVTHTADHRVQLFDISLGWPQPVGSVRVGLDPVAVNFRTDDELWVVNHISDSVSIVDVSDRRVIDVLGTGDEPFDVVFAADRAFVSVSQFNQLMVFASRNRQLQATIDINGEDPRSLAVSNDGRTVYAAIFESGNGSTVLGGGGTGLNRLDGNMVLGYPPNAVNDTAGPWGGINPPPNQNNEFFPGLLGNNPDAPPVGLIVKRNDQGQWMDDNQGNWTDMVSGARAAASGRLPGWTLGDRDIAAIDVESLNVSYLTGVMNIGMHLSVNPGDGDLWLIGTDARNEVRYEPNLNGRFLEVLAARVESSTGSVQRADLNPHLDYSQPRIAEELRLKSIGDPRGLAWSADGQRAWIVGLGSNNLIEVGADGQRAGEPVTVGKGPIGVVSDDARERLYVWNHFDASLSVIDSTDRKVLGVVEVFDPLPLAISRGRAFLYDTHVTSGTGHVSCASCHVDSRTDRLAWDLGNPAGTMKSFNQNCQTTLGVDPCEDWHPMKGPMTTQTLQDIVGNEPFHWRGDRNGIEEFNPAFVELLGADEELDAAQMQRFEDMLASIHFPPNPYRHVDNSLPEDLDLTGHFTTGRFGPAGEPLPNGDANRGLRLYTRDLLDTPLQCAGCHTLPTGMAVNGPLKLGNLDFEVGGSIMADGPLGENHLGLVSVDGSSNRSIKTPQLRNLYDKVGFDTTQLDNNAGFGFLHDGSVDSIARFVDEPVFGLRSDQDTADLVALMLSFSGSDFEMDNPFIGNDPPLSRDSHAAEGQQVVIGPDTMSQLAIFQALVDDGKVDLVVDLGARSYRYDASSSAYVSSDDTVDGPSLVGGIATVVPSGLDQRLSLDRDGDGVADLIEIMQGSNPADGSLVAFNPAAGLWFNPERNGHGFDLQRLGDFLFATWYTYNDDGSPTWYQAAGPFDQTPWAADLARITWVGDEPVAETVGTFELSFSARDAAQFNWQLGDRTGSENVVLIATPPGRHAPNLIGTWYDPADSGWGVSFYTGADTRVAVAYFYDADGEPRWALGQDANPVPVAEMAMQWFSGFCPDCPATSITPTSAGTVGLTLERPRLGTAAVDLNFEGSLWQRNPDQFIPLSDQALAPDVW